MSIFTRSQHTLLYTGVAAAAVFLVALIGGVPFFGAIIWGLLVGGALLLILRQSIFAETGEDVLDGAFDDALASMRTHAGKFQKVSGMEPPSKAKEKANAEASDATQPAALDAPRDGKPDDLARINGIGPKIVEELHAKGVYHYDQIAAWTKEEIAWIDRNLKGFKDRATRDKWVEQAKKLVKGED